MYKYCPYCGTKLIVQARFCAVCGAKQNAIIEFTGADESVGEKNINTSNRMTNLGYSSNVEQPENIKPKGKKFLSHSPKIEKPQKGKLKKKMKKFLKFILKIIRIGLIVLVAMAAIVLAAWLTVKFGIPQIQYSKARKEVLVGNYDSAIAIYTELSEKEFRDSADKILETKYQQGQALYDDKKYDEALAIYKELGTYSDSPSKANEVKYDKAMDLYTQKKYKDASLIFKTLYSYKDGKDKFTESVWVYANELIEEKKWEAALTELGQLTASLQTAEVVAKKNECYAALAEKAFNEGQYTKAQGYYLNTNNPDKTSDFYKECTYQAGLYQQKNKDYIGAVKNFESLGDYKDSTIQMNLAKYNYVIHHKNASDRTTFSYLKDLKAIGYKDSASIFKNLYQWKVTIVANADEDDEYTDLSSVSRYDTWYFHVRLTGGTPGSTAKLKYVGIFPDGEQVSDEWDFWWSMGETSWARFWYDDPLYGPSGKMTLKVYDENWNYLGEDSIRVT